MSDEQLSPGGKPEYGTCRECGMVILIAKPDHQCGTLPEWPDVDRGGKTKHFNFSKDVPYNLYMVELKTRFTKLDQYLENRIKMGGDWSMLLLYMKLKAMELEERWREQ